MNSKKGLVLLNDKKNKLNVSIFDMQPITPQIGGGRIRLAGLYHLFDKKVDVTYIGSYDWTGEKHRDQMTYENLREICIPLSKEHFIENEQLSNKAGFNCIDMMFNKLGFLSLDYIQAVRRLTYESDILIFSHPWVYELVKDFIDKKRHTIVYDSQNHEGMLRFELYSHFQNGYAEMVLKNVVEIEYELCLDADVILTCSENDLKQFNNLYEISIEKLKFVPNGVFFKEINKFVKPAPAQQSKKRVLAVFATHFLM